jgi:high affinity Mn2+ porin
MLKYFKNRHNYYAVIIVILSSATASLLLGETLNLDAPELWSIHYQATVIPQMHGYFNSPYSGTNSLSPNPEVQTSFTTTLFLGRRLWKGGEFYFNPELAAGEGLSGSVGLAGAANGETYRIGSTAPAGNISRLYFKQVFEMGGAKETIMPDKNQLGDEVCKNRLTLVLGKFSLSDFFDGNSYSHDPRTQFINWAIMDNGAWDFAADTRGYTWGAMLDYNRERWAARLASVLEPKVANQLYLDLNIPQAHSENAEFEYRYSAGSHPGKITVLGYANHAHMGNYRDSLNLSPVNPDIIQTETYCLKYGFGIDYEQEITKDLGCFLRAGWNDGATESWAFTEIDRTVSGGISLNGSSWNRPDDTFGLAFDINGLSADHRDYLEAGGYGFLIGDGKMNYAPEEILETYYLWKIVQRFSITGDFQLVNNPAYNQDRGPVSVFAMRLHYEI